MYYLLRAMEVPRNKKYWTFYVTASALGIYAHVFFYLVVAAQWLSVGYTLLRNHFRPTVWTAACLIVLTGPMTVFVLTKNQGQLNWVPRPTFLLLFEFAKLFTGYGGSALLAAYIGLCLIALFAAYQETNRELDVLDERRRVILVVSWLVFPIASTVLISFLHPIFYDRFMVISAPALVMLAGKGMADLDRVFPRARLVPSSLVLIASLSLWGIHRYDASPASHGDSWRLATHYVLAGKQSGDAAFFYRASGSRPFTYYAHREIEQHASTSSPVIIFPSNVVDARDFNVDPTEEQARRSLYGYKRIWLILQHYQGLSERLAAKQSIETVLQATYRVSQEKSFPGGDAGPIEVLLYDKSPTGN
jgi:mannosyltransferase